MSVLVKTQSNGSSIAVQQGNQSAAAVVIKKGGDITVQGLSNVVSTDLQNGYTLVFDSTTQKWVTQSLDFAANKVDGGTY